MASQSIQNPDGTYTLYDPSSYKPPQASPISVSGLTTPQEPLKVNQPGQTPIFPVASLIGDIAAQPTEPLKPTATEGQAQDFTTRLQELNNQYLGQSTYRTEQEASQGIPELKKGQSDLSARLKALQNEALAIPLQLQQEAQGRGITAGGLQPHQTAALRNNAIQALSVNSLLEASNGNLTTALDMVDRAVSQRFDPIKEEIDATTKNLELILNSPQYTLEQKNRAQAQLDQQNAKAEALALAKDDQKQIYDLAVKAASSGADQAVTLAIQQARSPEEALQIATQYGVLAPVAEPNLQTVKLDNGETVVIDMNTGETVRSLGGIKPGEVTPAPGTPGSSPLSTQPAYRKLTAKQKTQADAATNIVDSLNTYRANYEKLVRFSGSNIAGTDSALLESSYNALIFQVAQAVGTGALQQADREVIEKVIPNPTTISGSFDRILKGGKQGGLDKIDSQIAQFTNQLKNLGLTPNSPAIASQPTPSSPLSQRVKAAGYNYEQMRKDGFSDEQIEAALPK